MCGRTQRQIFSDSMEDFQETLNYILQALPKEFADVDVGIICGSGLGGLANTLEGRTYELAYSVSKTI